MAKMPSVTLLERAKSDRQTAQTVLDNFSDEVYLDVAAYHIHQCLEKCLMFA